MMKPHHCRARLLTAISIARSIAGCAGFLILIHSRRPPERLRLSRRFATMPSSPLTHAWRNTTVPSRRRGIELGECPCPGTAYSRRSASRHARHRPTPARPLGSRFLSSARHHLPIFNISLGACNGSVANGFVSSPLNRNSSPRRAASEALICTSGARRISSPLTSSPASAPPTTTRPFCAPARASAPCLQGKYITRDTGEHNLSVGWSTRVPPLIASQPGRAKPRGGEPFLKYRIGLVSGQCPTPPSPPVLGPTPPWPRRLTRGGVFSCAFAGQDLAAALRQDGRQLRFIAFSPGRRQVGAFYLAATLPRVAVHDRLLVR